MAQEVKQRNNRVLVIVGAVLAVAAFGLSLYLSQRNSGSGTSSSGGSNAPLVTAVVATSDIPKDTKITDTQVAVKQLPQDQVPVGSPTTTTSIVGQFVSVDVKANQVMQSS
ncbi:MAG TPA: SAF domain-containing protein, partial [Candidatus Dormibacteraeota bacterium]|nr:SAF domain-containing protein [Candidatus Dormibacteraeota bacterium]